MSKIESLVSERRRVIAALQTTNRDRVKLQHRCDELACEIARMTGVPLLGDIVPPALDMFAGLGRRPRKRI